MECAIELLLTKSAALEAKRKQEEAEEARRKAEQAEFEAKRKKAVYENTINWLENEVAFLLHQAAENPNTKKIEVSFPIRLSDDWEEFVLLSREISRRGNEYYCGVGGYMDYKTMKNYLAKYCLEALHKRQDFNCGNGYPYLNGAVLTITVKDPECM